MLHNTIEAQDQETEVEERCPNCRGTGHVTVMGYVYPHEPHMAMVGEEICEECQGSGVVIISQ